MVNALWITLIGMGLVFIAILLLWGGMALLVRLTTEREPRKTGGEAADQRAALEADAASRNLAAHKRRAAAAAAAVSVALALYKPPRLENGAGAGSALSAWQSVNRARQVNQAANYRREKVAR